MAEPQVIPFPGRNRRLVTPLLSFSGVRYGGSVRPLLDGLDLSIGPGGITALLGPNGAGKSLCLRLAAGLIEPDGGTIDRTLPLARIGVMPQRAVLLRRTVRGNLMHALRLAGLGWRARRDRLETLLALGRLQGLARRPAWRLSGGEAQRVALMRALACDPAVLLLDEPGAGLDPAATAALESLISRIAAEGVTVLLVTHDLAQARRLASEVIFLSEGRLAETGAAESFFTRPRSEEARTFLAGHLA